MTTHHIAALIVGHLVADWYCQGTWEATNKSRCIWALMYHCVVYIMVVAPFALAATEASLFWVEDYLKFLIFNFVAHMAVDYITSSMTFYYHAMRDRSMFFNTIGTDQAIHMLFLIYSADAWLF